MARPIEDTPVLKGKDAERFYERLATVEERRISPEERKRLQEVYEAGMAMMVD